MVVLSPDGVLVVSGSNDMTVRVWDVQTGQCLHICDGHTAEVNTVIFSPADKLVASGSSDKTVRVWDVQTGQCLHTCEGHTGKLSSVIFSPDGSRMASGSSDKTVRVWDMQTSDWRQTLEGHLNTVRSLVAMPDLLTKTLGLDDKTDQNPQIEDRSCNAETAHIGPSAAVDKLECAQKPQDLHLDDVETIHSDASSLPDLKEGNYVSDLADDLLNGIPMNHRDNQTMDRISRVLLELLKAFALKIGHNAPTQMHRDVMVFVHKQQSAIVGSFKDRSAPERENTPDVQSGDHDQMPLEEKLRNWCQNLTSTSCTCRAEST